MNFLKYTWVLIALLISLAMASCDNNNDPDPVPDPVPEPEPVSIALTLQSATLEGEAIDPLPNYSLTINFDAQGNPDGFTASGDAKYQPSVGTTGTFSVTSGVVTFTSGAESKSATITSGEISRDTQTVALSWEVNKIDIGFDADEDGTYVYTLSVQ